MTEEILAYCVKCRRRIALQNPEPKTLRNGDRAFKGECPTCACGIYKIVEHKGKAVP